MKKKKKKNRQNSKLDLQKNNDHNQKGKFIIGLRPDGTLFHEAFFGTTADEVDLKINEYVESLQSGISEN